MSEFVSGSGWDGGQAAFAIPAWDSGNNDDVPAFSGGDFSATDPAWNTGADDTGGNNGDGRAAGGDQACFNCGETGHRKADCTKPRVFQGACRRCNEEGHMSKDCPNRLCNNCGNTGHTITQCTGARKIDRSAIPDMDKVEAWENIKKMAKTRDIDDIKEAIQIYIKAVPETTYAELERAFRGQEIPIWLIAIERELLPTLTLMDLQGNLNKKYKVTYRTQWNAPRPSERELWPKDIEENIERLKDAGEPTDRMLPKCDNCGEVGHGAKHCPQEKMERPNTVEIRCFNCNEVGHRVRDCPVPRVDKFACKNCGESGHKVAECPKPRSMADVDCRKCGEKGHMARDCPQGGGGRSNTCRNCDEEGHIARDCPRPRDMSRVKCNKCGELGHFQHKCPNPGPSDGDELAGAGWNSGAVNGNGDDQGSGADVGGANGETNGFASGWELPVDQANTGSDW